MAGFEHNLWLISRPFGPLKPSPVEDRRTQLDNRGVQGPQGMREAEAASFTGSYRLTLTEGLIEERLVQSPRPMGIGIGQRGSRRRPSHAEVDELAVALARPPQISRSEYALPI